MTCEEFKHKMVDLFDKNVDNRLQEECNKHMRSCPSCKNEYEEYLMIIKSINPTIKSKKRGKVAPIRSPKTLGYIRQIAAVLLIFLLGLGTGLSNFFSTSSEASPTPTILYNQAMYGIENARSFHLELLVRTPRQENFASIDPNSDFVPIDIKVMRYNGNYVWRVEKDGGQRTVVCDGNKQYHWTASNVFVVGHKDACFLEGYKNLLHPEVLFSELNKAATMQKNDVECFTTDSTYQIVTKSSIYYCQFLPLNHKELSDKELLWIETVFSKENGQLRSLKVWQKKDGKTVVLLYSKTVTYNSAFNISELLKKPQIEENKWIPLEQPKLKDQTRLEFLQKESAEVATRRIVNALIAQNDEDAKEALYYYQSQMDVVFALFKDCSAQDFSKPKKKKYYAGVYVTFKLIHKNGKVENKTIALRRDNDSNIWIVDGGI